MPGRADHEHLVVAHVRRHQVAGHMRGLDKAEPRLDVPDKLDHRGGVGDGELHDGRRVVRGPLAHAQFARPQLDQPVRHEVLGDGLAGGDRQPVRHP
jgi:hypothetical protein